MPSWQTLSHRSAALAASACNAIDSCRTTTGGYLFFDPLGNAAVDYAGFAYLPNGPSLDSDGGFELQELNHLQGPWYAFVASW